MSIASALSNALSGLRASSRQAEIVSSNVANASTPGYARRSVALTAAMLGGSGQGVRITGILRHSDDFLLRDRRLAQSSAHQAEARSTSLATLERIFGNSNSAGSLSSRINDLEAAFLTAAANPQSETGLSRAVSAAQSLASAVQTASKQIQTERTAADSQIAEAVKVINSGLAQVQLLNIQITAQNGAGRDASALLDQRQQVIDNLSSYLPIRQFERADGQVALATSSGAVLLDGPAGQFEFTRSPSIVAEMSVGNGALSGLSLNGRPLVLSGSNSQIAGGKLGALFETRDNFSVQAQARLDGLARDLIERFEQPGLDDSLTSGEPGLFTDAGGVFDPALETALAGRLRVNTAVLPEAGGSLSALRSGLGSGGLGPVGDASLLVAFANVLAANHPTGSASFSAGSRSASTLAAEISSSLSSARLSAESDYAYASGRYIALLDLEAAMGVDTDAEMQSLLVIEKHFAANAKVIQAVDEMLDLLVGL